MDCRRLTPHLAPITMSAIVCIGVDTGRFASPYTTTDAPLTPDPKPTASPVPKTSASPSSEPSPSSPSPVSGTFGA